jgi:arginyl-tRNA synthetase
MNIEQKLTATVIAALNALYGQEVPEKMVQLQKTKKELEQTAQEFGEYLKLNVSGLDYCFG